MINPIKINELKESDLPSTFKLKKQTKTKIYNKYMDLNKSLLISGYMPITFPDFVHLLLEIGVDKFTTDGYIKEKIEKQPKPKA